MIWVDLHIHTSVANFFFLFLFFQGVLKVRKRVTLSVITVSAIFGACWITGLLIYILSYLDILLFGSISYVLSDTLFMFNSAINPFVYALLNERFRQKIKMLCRTSRISRVHTSSKHGIGPQNNTSPVTDTVNVQWNNATGPMDNNRRLVQEKVPQMHLQGELEHGRRD